MFKAEDNEFVNDILLVPIPIWFLSLIKVKLDIYIYKIKKKYFYILKLLNL